MKILLRTGSGLGNVLMAIPLMHSLRRAGWTIYVHIKDCPYHASCISAISHIAAASTKEHEFADIHFDVAANCYSFRHSSFTIAVARITYGYPSNKDITEHSEVDWNLDIATLLKITPIYDYSCNVDSSCNESFDIGIHAGCSKSTFWDRKKWPHFGKLADSFLGKKIVVIGDKTENIQSKNVISRLGLPFLQTASIIRNCKVFVTNDSGMMHLANAVSTPTIALFGPTLLSKAVGPKTTIIPLSLNMECSPCQNSDRWNTCKSWDCMNNLSVDIVKEKIDEILGK